MNERMNDNHEQQNNRLILYDISYVNFVCKIEIYY